MSGVSQARRSGDRAKRLRRVTDVAAMVFGVFLVLWSILPLYNMVRVALQEKEDVFKTDVLPTAPTLHSFEAVFTESYWLLKNFWGQISTIPSFRLSE